MVIDLLVMAVAASICNMASDCGAGHGVAEACSEGVRDAAGRGSANRGKLRIMRRLKADEPR